MVCTVTDVDGKNITFHMRNVVAVVTPPSALLFQGKDAAPATGMLILNGVMSNLRKEEAWKLEKAYLDYCKAEAGVPK